MRDVPERGAQERGRRDRAGELRGPVRERITAPAPAKTSANVPIASATSARESGTGCFKPFVP